MAEFIDVVFHIEPGSGYPPGIYIEDDHGVMSSAGMFLPVVMAKYGYEFRVRIQHDEIEKL